MSQTPSTPLRFVHAASVGDTARALQQPGFIERCVDAYEAIGFGTPSESEVRSWRNSWPPLVDALVRAGLEDLWIHLEFATLDTNSRMDALLLGRGENGLAGVVVELKQWSRAAPVANNLLRVPGDEKPATHPVAQTAGYMAFLENWFESDTVELNVRGVAYLHNADREQTAEMRNAAPPALRVPVIGRDDVRTASGSAELRDHFLCGDLRGVGEQDLKQFAEARWRAGARLLDGVVAALRKEPSFTLVGDQQTAFLDIRATVDQRLRNDGRRTFVIVRGGPGSGKTVLAMRLLGDFLNEPAVLARYGTPSGALTRTLRETVGVPGSAPLFQMPRNRVKDCGLMIIDEVHRYRRFSGGFGSYVLNNLADVPVVVVFLDERQRVRPSEGVTEKEIRDIAAGADSEIDVVVHDLNGNFRCNGSREFVAWIDDLLYGTPRAWDAHDYDLDVTENPSSMERWLAERVEEHRAARISAGFCWGWEEVRLGEELPGVVIEWENAHGDTQQWHRPWNLHKQHTVDLAGGSVGPESWLWATQEGGERQVGCIYTAQGLEYDDAGVIIGPDLVRRGDRWEAHPETSHDKAMRGVDTDQYLDFALNTYRVLMTRGMKSCRLYSTDEETREFLRSLMPTGRR
ncbi:hypothetical protein SAMN05421803_10445 [Nocardiopsis flavescens]|uniref:Schlafen group 3-like DNA/RNA helicase domain-containing protein n=1 Tax=Nocardiopsis flavescens TaxID=758803 RepID=A0A1M6H5R7_9ACTN|nr:DNA/RNA helicase domain-containing protein [Nocardiopsis flavescens]SHJ17526.1 hypothetical protein SAMN05421803_10445 [Nocardiopsis flavescens]